MGRSARRSGGVVIAFVHVTQGNDVLAAKTCATRREAIAIAKTHVGAQAKRDPRREERAMFAQVLVDGFVVWSATT